MKIYNGYFGNPREILNHLHGSLSINGANLVIGTGYFQLYGDVFDEFLSIIENWFRRHKDNRLTIYIGNHAHEEDDEEIFNKKIKSNSLSAAHLLKRLPDFNEQIEIHFVDRLHAKFYSLWRNDNLVWAVIGSSNLTNAALDDKNLEIDILFEEDDINETLRETLRGFIKELYLDENLNVSEIVDDSRYEAELTADLNKKKKLIQEEKEMESARKESDIRQGIYGGS